MRICSWMGLKGDVLKSPERGVVDFMSIKSILLFYYLCGTSQLSKTKRVCPYHIKKKLRVSYQISRV